MTEKQCKYWWPGYRPILDQTCDKLEDDPIHKEDHEFATEPTYPRDYNNE